MRRASRHGTARLLRLLTCCVASHRRPTFAPGRPARPTDSTPSVLGGCPPYLTTPFSASGPFAFAVLHTSPEFWMVLQFLAPVFDTRLEFWAVFPSHRLEKCLRAQTTEPLTWGFPIPSTSALAIMASKPPRRFWTPHRSPLQRPPQPASPLRRSPLRCLPLPTSMPATARTIHMRRDFASVNNRRRNLAVHAIRSPATAQQTSAALPPSRRYPRKARGLFLQDLAKGFARRRRQTASMPAHIPDALTHR